MTTNRNPTPSGDPANSPEAEESAYEGRSDNPPSDTGAARRGPAAGGMPAEAPSPGGAVHDEGSEEEDRPELERD